MTPEIDYIQIGKRIKSARTAKGYSQAYLGELVGCSNNHMSHIEVGQTKVSLSMLMKISYALEKNLDYFLLDTPFADTTSIINLELANKLNRCNSTTLITVNKIIDILLDQQCLIEKEIRDNYM